MHKTGGNSRRWFILMGYKPRRSYRTGAEIDLSLDTMFTMKVSSQSEVTNINV